MRKTTVWTLLISATLLVASTAFANTAYVPHQGAKQHQEPRSGTNCSYSNECFGRCGPGCGYQSVMGYKVTTACTNHDQCVKDRQCIYGDSSWSSHVNCAGGLPSAAASYVQAHFNGAANWLKDTGSGVWKKIKSFWN